MQNHKQAGLLIQFGQPINCNKRRKMKKAMHECSMISHKWENMDPDMLREIFSRTPTLDLFLNVSSVCQSWEKACWDFLFWSRSVLDLSGTGAGFGLVKMSNVLSLDLAILNRVPGYFGELDSPEKYNKMATDLMRKLRRIMEGEYNDTCSAHKWGLSVQTLIVPYDLEISDKHLLYIAERTRCLQHLVLLCPSKITLNGFSKVVKAWKQIKELHIGQLHHDVFNLFIEAIGRNCPGLESLHIHHEDFVVAHTCAQVIAESMPGLKKLEFEFGIVRPSGILTLFKMCPQMEEVYLNLCVLKREIEPLLPIDTFPQTANYRLSWTVNDKGLPIFEIKPCFTDVEKFNQWEGKPFTGEFLLDPEFRESMRVEKEIEFDHWLLGGFGRSLR